jgi:hypothetical protein
MDILFIYRIIEATKETIERQIKHIDKNSDSVIKDIEIMIYNNQIEELKEYQLKLKLNIFNIKDLRFITYRLRCLYQQTNEQWIEQDLKELYIDLEKILKNENNNTKRIALK